MPRLLAAAFVLLLISPVNAADFYVAPDGKPSAPGTRDAPWDLASALAADHFLQPGDTLWLAGGAYKHLDRKTTGFGFPVKLAGRKDKPVRIRAGPGQRVTIDGGLSVVAPATALWIQDLEILVSENLTRPRVTKQTGSSPTDLDRPWGGLNVHAGADCKYIDLVIHDNAQGVSFWKGATDSELYGCLIYDNGWSAPDRGHGHAIYTQNQDGLKTIADCIMTGGYGYTLHAYGSKNAYVDNYLVEGNIAYAGGIFLIGGGRPSRGIRVFRNFLHGVSMQIGYDAPENEDCEVRGNVVVGGLDIKRYKKVVNEGNVVVGPDAARAKGALAVLRPNKYDPLRANLAVYNWDKGAEVTVDASAWLKDGQAFELRNPKDFFGKPVQQGRCQAGKIRIAAPTEFSAFVVLKTP